MAPVAAAAAARLRMCYPPRKWLLGVQAAERNQLGSLGLPIYSHSRYNMDIIEYIGSKYVQINRCTFRPRVKQSCRHWVFCFEWQQQTCWTWMFQYIVIIVTCRFPFFSTLSFMLKATEMIFMTTCSSRPFQQVQEVHEPNLPGHGGEGQLVTQDVMWCCCPMVPCCDVAGGRPPSQFSSEDSLLHRCGRVDGVTLGSMVFDQPWL